MKKVKIAIATPENDARLRKEYNNGLAKAAKLLDVSAATIRLHAGEMSAQEMRSVRAVLDWKKAEIEALINGQ